MRQTPPPHNPHFILRPFAFKITLASRGLFRLMSMMVLSLGLISKKNRSASARRIFGQKSQSFIVAAWLSHG